MYCLRFWVTIRFRFSREWNPVGSVTWFPVLTPGAHALRSNGGRLVTRLVTAAEFRVPVLVL